MAEPVGRGSLTGRWQRRSGACPNIRGGITIERDLRAGTKLTIEIDRFVIGQLEANGYLEDARDGSKLADAVELFISDHMPQSEPA